MELSNRVTFALFALLSVLLVFSREEPIDSGVSHGIWRGELTTVTGKGGMLSTESGNYWVSETDLAEISLKGDSVLVFGRHSGMFISPFSIRLKPSSSIFSSFRRQYRSRLYETIPDPVARGLTGGLLMGFRGLIPVDIANAFKNSGTSHLLALSGLHTAVVALVLLFVSKFIFGNGVFSGWMAVVGIILFVVLSGARASTVRAGIMASSGILWIIYRGGRLNLLSVWWIALLLSLAFLPGTLNDKGAQMSYGAVLSLILFGRNFKGKYSAVFSPLFAGVVITVSLAPLMISIYGGLSYLGPLATLVSLPFMLAVMALGFLASTGFQLAGVVLQPISGWWVNILKYFSHSPISLPENMLYPLWGILLIGLRVFSKWNRFNRRFR